MARVIPRMIIATTDKTHCYQALLVWERLLSSQQEEGNFEFYHRNETCATLKAKGEKE